MNSDLLIQPAGLDMAMGKVTLSPDVVREVARITTLATPGVFGLAEKPEVHGSLRGKASGVEVTVQDEKVQIRVHVVASTELPLYKLGQQIQAGIISAVAEVAGIDVTSVDVTFVNVRSKA